MRGKLKSPPQLSFYFALYGRMPTSYPTDLLFEQILAAYRQEEDLRLSWSISILSNKLTNVHGCEIKPDCMPDGSYCVKVLYDAKQEEQIKTLVPTYIEGTRVFMVPINVSDRRHT